MTAAGVDEPEGRRWALSARSPAVRTAPTTRKYFRISIIPSSRKPRRHYELVAGGAAEVQLRPYSGTGRPIRRVQWVAYPTQGAAVPAAKPRNKKNPLGVPQQDRHTT